jgi:hypothetical protein
MIKYEFTRVLSFLTDAILMLNYSSNLKLIELDRCACWRVWKAVAQRAGAQESFPASCWARGAGAGERRSDRASCWAMLARGC